MDVNKSKSYIRTVEDIIGNKVSDDTAAAMLVDCKYSSDIESARRTVILIHNDIGNFMMNRDMK